MGHDKSSLAYMSIKAPSTGIGSLYFDYLEFQTSLDWARVSDTQYSVVQSSLSCNFLSAYNAKLLPVISPTAAQLAGADSVTSMLDQWELGTGAYNTSSVLLSRKNSISKFISYAQSYYTGLNLLPQSDGTILGIGLFSGQSSTVIDGVSTTLIGDVNSKLPIQYALDYRLYGNTTSKNKLINVYDYLNEQGWAGGSALGSLRFQNILNTSEYLNSVYLMLNVLDSVRLKREMNTVKWYSLFGDALVPVYLGPRGVDDMRSILTGKFIYACITANRS